MMHNAIIYLHGHYGVGKLTIAREIAALTGARVFDNHLANNVVFSLIREDGSTPIPEGAWPLIMTIRRQALTAMAELARPDASFVLTNALMEEDPIDHAAFADVMDTATRRGATFVPVLLTASDLAHAERIPAPERAARLKMTDADGAARKRATSAILKVAHPNRLEIDTTDILPEAAARRIIEHARALGASNRP